MPAPSYKVLFDFKTQIEQAAYQILAAGGITPGMPGQETERVPVSTTTVSFAPGGATGDKGLVADKLNEEYDTFEGVLTVENMTDFLVDEENGDGYLTREHVRRLDELCATEHALFMEHIRPFGAYLDYLDVQMLMPIEPDEAPESEREVNVARKRWRLRYKIRSDAWPVV